MYSYPKYPLHSELCYCSQPKSNLQQVRTSSTTLDTNTAKDLNSTPVNLQPNTNFWKTPFVFTI
ncbi:hypothetical protein CANTEDRAFT_112351 [Yamadazyma tenuis ATCC 10573]|uniref:Uncharacterized protein n=1 Tax=Candida tenuis (strain ATCC 10573 / BCRC 21748 / CBS 615 / JCM 9827 / NBRC 10315 / NRRL Y-1498 / VKM Y-70) TaxID=590646 RepID=G3AWX3_CANTC|nr:uncharacterized protein CANTEDRAFT_112351 [Yamadazyma tenuis ATCC 10573]EGV66642.1 hypothetical protein CANTEDRAFT_112351 [Yamadazyma tenuis ATCC 10573]